MRALALVLASSLAWAAHCADTDSSISRKKSATDKPASLRSPATSPKGDLAKQPRLPVAPESSRRDERREERRSEARQRHLAVPRERQREEKKQERASLSPQNRVAERAPSTSAPVEAESRQIRRDRSERKKKDEGASLSSAPPGTASHALGELRERRRQEERAERAKLAAPAVLIQQQPPVLKSQPRLPVAAEPPKAATQVFCSASPRCPEAGHACQDVAFSYGGGGQNVVAAGRQDVVRACRQANALDACCAQHCASAAHCTGR